MSILSNYQNKLRETRKIMDEMFEVSCSRNLSEKVKYKIIRDARESLAIRMGTIYLDCPNLLPGMTAENVGYFLDALVRVLGREPVDESAGHN